MNPFWSEPDSLHAELDIRTPEDPEVLARVARRWIESAVGTLAGGQVQALRDGPALTSRSLARHQGAFGEPGTPWGSLVVEPDERKRQASLHAWTPQTWEQFLAAAETNSCRMEVELSRLDEHGSPGGGDLVRVAVQRDYAGYQGWTRLIAFRTPRPADDAAWERAAQDWASFLAEQAAALEVPVAAGFVADDMGADFRTPFELAVDLMAEEVLGTDLLRQYSWLTLVHAGALQRLGGVGALQESGAFASVTPLPTGGALLRATDRLLDYTEAAYGRVFEALAPALPPGEPRRLELDRQRRLVYRDATEVLSG